MMSLPHLAHHADIAAGPPKKALRSPHLRWNSSDITTLGLSTTWADVLSAHGGTTKKVLWVRHGEGSHNAAERRVGKERWEEVEAKSPVYFDPDLNEVGREQSVVLAGAFDLATKEHGMKIDLIVVSPLTRAIRTAEIALGAVWMDTPVVAVEMARERFGKNVCDKRRTVAELKSQFPHIDFDRFMVAEEDPWFTEERESVEHVRERVRKLLEWINAIPDVETIVIVGHSDYMSNAVEVVGLDPHWPANCEVVPMLL